MAETEPNPTADSAEKAYAEAAARIEAAAAAKPAANEPEFTPAPALVAEVTLPALKSAPAKKPVAAEPAKAPVAAEPVKAPAKVVAKKVPAIKRAPAAKASPVKAPTAIAPVKAAKPRRVVATKSATAKPVAAKAAVSKPRAVKPAVVSSFSVTQLKEKIMTQKTTDFTESFKSAVADAQGKAKVAYDKGTAVFGEATEFTKGNVEALVESTKILGSGLQELTTGYVAESKSAFETLTADVKALAAVKSPVDFFKLQGEIARRNFDKVVSFGSKNSEAVLKLTNEVVAPISGRVSLAVEKVKKAA